MIVCVCVYKSHSYMHTYMRGIMHTVIGNELDGTSPNPERISLHFT